MMNYGLYQVVCKYTFFYIANLILDGFLKKRHRKAAVFMKKVFSYKE